MFHFWDVCFNINLERRLLFCIPETSEYIIISITRTLHLLLSMLLNWFWSLLDSLYCNEGQSCYYRSNKTQQLLGSELNRKFWNLKHWSIFFLIINFKAVWKLKKRTARLSTSESQFLLGIWNGQHQQNSSTALNTLVTWVQT